MMTWGALSGALVFGSYTLLLGLVDLSDPTMWLLMLGGGAFVGYTLGALSGMLLGFTLVGHSENFTQEAIHNRRYHAYGTVFVSVFLLGLVLMFVGSDFGYLAHPVTLSLIAALLSTVAAWHYLYRIEQWLLREKPKRKEEAVDTSRLVGREDRDSTVTSTRERQIGRNRKS